MAECRRLAIDGPPQLKPPDDGGRSKRPLGIRCRREQDLGIRQAPGPECFEVDGNRLRDADCINDAHLAGSGPAARNDRLG